MSRSTPAEIFSARLREVREVRELSQAELAGRTGLQASAISHFETGTRRPSFANLRRLADALHVSTDYLLGRTEEMLGTSNSDVMFRDIGKLTARDQEVIRDLAAQMAARKRKGSGSGS